jgi:uncharacterized protein YicC (UPF0701 family)
MTVSAIDLYNILKIRIGEGEAKALVEYIEMHVQDKIEENMTAYATKADLKEEIHRLELKIEKVRSDLIKWMFIFWAGQTGLLIGLLKLFFK